MRDAAAKNRDPLEFDSSTKPLNPAIISTCENAVSQVSLMRSWAAILFVTLAGLLQADEPIDYARQVKPLLAGRCFACHGALKQEGSLRLDTAAAMRTGGDTGAAITPGQSTVSLLIQRVIDKDDAARMPPHEVGTALTPKEVSLLTRWIDEGAPSPADEKPETDPADHWAFRSIDSPAVPSRFDASVDNIIDAFLADKRAQNHLELQPVAPKGILLRRVYLDLVGVPPTKEDLDEFNQDNRPDAFEQVVDRLLASPQHGERWGRHWMDIWRYSDWWGLGADLRNSQKHIWHWRDWIIASLNNDVGYDEMVRLMLAADELHPTDTDRLRATGFLARQYFKFNRNTWLDDTVEHTSKAFLGLTMNCAKCHDHKYDPIAQTNYYQFRAFFEPYQVRTDQIPGELDFEKDGIPRAFDCNLSTPTYLFIRGDEKQPKKDSALSPGLPAILTAKTGDIQIKPVSLPPESYQPSLRTFVLEDHLRVVEKRIVEARHSLERASQVKASLEQQKASPKDFPLFATSFEGNRGLLWDDGPGEWKVEENVLRQSQVGETSAKLKAKFEVPVDFEAKFRFVIQGGNRWKSVGMNFDANETSEVFVYLSAVDGGSKLQVGYKKDGKADYPAEAQLNRTVKLGELQEFVMQIRGNLINVFMDGALQLAWRLPIDRKPGRLELWTYDAKADFKGFELSKLGPDHGSLPLVAIPPTTVTIEQANAAREAADRSVAFAEAEPDLLHARVAADRARTSSLDSAETASLIHAASMAEREQAVRKASADVALAELEQLAGEARKKAEADKKVTTTREALAKAEAARDSKEDVYTSLVGSRKSLESNVEDEASRSKPFPATSSGRRRALAEWLTNPNHPLTSRVAVNHIWARHFGRPLVETVFDFGRKGTPPTHPELLDYLAKDFMEHGWEMKNLHRQLVTSRTYQATSSEVGVAAETQTADPENKLYWRMNPVRMESQVVRDASLALANELDLKMEGPPIALAEQDKSRRRSLYFVHSHNDQDPFLTVFDNANVLQCYRRSDSIVPQQALALSNSRLSIDVAHKIAAQYTAASSDAEFVRLVFNHILAAPPTADEEAACLETMAEYRSKLTDRPADIVTQRARLGIVHALMNHNDFITIR